MERSIRDSQQLINYLERCDNDTQQLITTGNVVIETNNVDKYKELCDKDSEQLISTWKELIRTHKS